jgi:phosphohistidine phosphatase SixA
MKTIILMRHGSYDNSTSKLSDYGKKEVDIAAKAAVNDNLAPDLIVHSPLPRAVETAERIRDVFARISGKIIPLVCNDALEVGRTRVGALTQGIEDSVNTVLAVTHQPNVESLTRQFGEVRSPSTAEINVFQSDVDSWTNVRAVTFVKKL